MYRPTLAYTPATRNLRSYKNTSVPITNNYAKQASSTVREASMQIPTPTQKRGTLQLWYSNTSKQLPPMQDPTPTVLTVPKVTGLQNRQPAHLWYD